MKSLHGGVFLLDRPGQWLRIVVPEKVASPALLAVDLATHKDKNYARMQIHYKITVATTGETLLNQITKVTFKKCHLPQEKIMPRYTKNAHDIRYRSIRPNDE